MDIKDLDFGCDKKWKIPIPSPDTNAEPLYRTVSQTKFYNEYFPSSHKIFDPQWYKDLTMYDKKGRAIGTYHVSRVSVPIQMMSIDIILAHLLGNKTHIVDGTLKENEALPYYKEYWTTRNIDTAVYEFIKSVLSLADGAILLYKENKELKWQRLSLFDDDKFKMEYDKYGKPFRFYKFYDNKCDVYDHERCVTYVSNEKWVEEKREFHGFKGIPVVYRCRKEGPFWIRAQSNTEDLEKMLSRLSEDNRKKFKSLYHLKTADPKSVKTESSGLTDMVITDPEGDFKLVSGAEMSDQFKFEFETQLELIFNSLGIVFPKHKSSGDMPTGSMKMMFYPTERVVMSLIREFDSAMDDLNDIVKQGFAMEHPEYLEQITKGNIRASIRMFTPQDDTSKVDSVVKLKKEGVISGETAAEETPYAANNEVSRIEREKEKSLDEEKKRQNLRLI